MVAAVVIISTAAIRTPAAEDADLQAAINSGIAQDFGRLASDFISIEFIVNGELQSNVHVSYSTITDPVSICIGWVVCACEGGGLFGYVCVCIL